jgi:hypothetical protein
VTDFGSIEIQAVYISGNVRQPFSYYMEDREGRKNMIWSKTHVRPDYLSSSRKRLVPQMIYKGNILKNWNKKQAVVLHKSFFDMLPSFPSVTADEAEIAWLIYDFRADKAETAIILNISARCTPAIILLLKKSLPRHPVLWMILYRYCKESWMKNLRIASRMHRH